jgi:two-component system sensor histidine kinase KdpD
VGERDQIRRARPAALAASAAECVLAVAIATAGVAALQGVAAATRLGVIYLLAVLEVAIRRGEQAALLTAVLCVLTLNFFFITPRHRLAIAHSQDVVELVVFLIVAVVVGRLAAMGRRRAREAESRALIANAREREATLLAEAASAILVGRSMRGQLESLGSRVAAAVGASRARVVLEPVPRPSAGEVSVPLRSQTRNAWLYVSEDLSWTRAEVERIAEPLGRLIDVAIERERLADAAAETEAAGRAEVARTAILHAISHDLRSPLTAITTAGSALQADSVTADERAELLDVIDTEAARLARLVDDLLDLSKIQAGASNPRSDWCDIGDVVASAAAQYAEHPIEFNLPRELPLVRADAAQLERVFSNLIENAIKFSPPGEPVTVSAGTSSGKLTVRVLDRGRGIPPQNRSRVFEPFFRGRGEHGPGSGLGLAISRGFVEANGGRILFQPNPGGGSSFAVSFPIQDQPQAVG